MKLGQLPAGPAYTTQGKGTFHILKGTSPKVGTGRLYRYEIEVEDGVTGVDTAQYATWCRWCSRIRAAGPGTASRCSAWTRATSISMSA